MVPFTAERNINECKDVVLNINKCKDIMLNH